MRFQEPDCECVEISVRLTEGSIIRVYHELERDEARRIFKLRAIRRIRVGAVATRCEIHKRAWRVDRRI